MTSTSTSEGHNSGANLTRPDDLDASDEYKRMPRVSIFHMLYNQVDGLEKAFNATVSQSYPNLEIVFSDDHSTDGTYEKLQKLAANYNGPHELILTQNSQNRGIVGNFNTAGKKTAGALVVQVNGDDVARADRVSKLVELWRSEPNVMLVSSLARYVDSNGTELRLHNHRKATDYDKNLASIIIEQMVEMGSCNGYDRTIFEEFGDVPDIAIVEDHVMTMRAVRLGKVRKCNEVLVDVRSGGISWQGETPEEQAKHRAFNCQSKVTVAKAMCKDIKGFKFQGKWRVIAFNYLMILRHLLGLKNIPGRPFVEAIIGHRR